MIRPLREPGEQRLGPNAPEPDSGGPPENTVDQIVELRMEHLEMLKKLARKIVRRLD